MDDKKGKIKKAPDLSQRKEFDFDLIDKIARKAAVQTISPPDTQKSLRPTSFRLRQEDKARLADLATRVKKESGGRKISESVIIGALLLMAEKRDIKVLINAVRESIL